MLNLKKYTLIHFLLLKKQHPDAEVLFVKVFPYTRVQYQISAPNDLSVFHYSLVLSLKIYGDLFTK